MGRSISARLSEISQSLFFIVGHPRGGTTLLQSMFSSHSRITIPPETLFFLEVWPKRQRFGNLADEDARQRLVTFLQSEDCSIADLQLDGEDILAFLRALLGEQEGATPINCADVFVCLMTLWAAQRGKPRVGDKSPTHMLCVPQIATVFPQAKFIACLRDPRAVVSSSLQTDWGGRSVDQVSRRWNRIFDQHQRLCQLLPPERYTMVQYEDLVLKAEETLKKLCGFLNESFEPQMLQYDKRPASELGFSEGEEWKRNTLKPLDPARSTAWKRNLRPEQIAIIERITGARLVQLGYQRTGLHNHIPCWQYMRARVSDLMPWIADVLTGRARRGRKEWLQQKPKTA